MIILVKPEAKHEDVNSLIEMIKNLNAEPIYIHNENAITVLPHEKDFNLSDEIISSIPCVKKIVSAKIYSKVV